MKEYEIVKEWTHKNLKCRIILNISGTTQWYCAYVGIPKNHKLWGNSYEELESDIDVHGGITFSEQGSNTPSDIERCQRIRWPYEDIWWLGFDFAHGGDYTGKSSLGWEHHWTLREVIKETNKLANQLEELK